MTTFMYEARDQEGQLATGTISAESAKHAGRLLSQRDLFVIRLGAETGRRNLTTRRAKATRAEVAWAFTQLSVMVETGIRLTDGLDCLARNATRPALKSLLEHLSQTVQEGHSLSDAMEMHPKSFPGSLTALIRSSELSGTMGRVLRRSSAYLLSDLQVVRKVRGAVMYPAFMFAVCVAVTVFLLTVILPRFASIFEQRGATLPLPTRVLMSLSENLINHWYLWILTALAIMGAAMILGRTPASRRLRDRLLVTLPVLSKIFRPFYQCRAFRVVSVLLDAGVNLADGVRITQDVVANDCFRRLWKQVEERMQRGETMAEPFLKSRLVPEQVALMIDSGERSGRLGPVFSNLADFIEEEYKQTVQVVTRFIEPVMILCLGGIIGFVASSLMLPLFQAGRVVAG